MLKRISIKKKKVYCENCKHIEYGLENFTLLEQPEPVCKKTEMKIDTPVKIKHDYIDCFIINEKNDCKRFKKDWFGWLR